MTLETKECSKCKVVKPAQDFGPRKVAKDGLKSNCRECCNKTSRARHHRLAEANAKLSIAEIRQNTPEARCSECKQTKPSVHFSRNNYSRIGLQTICRSCDTVVTLRWSSSNRDRHNSTAARYRARKKRLFWEDLALEQILERDGLGCAWCGVIPDEYHVDHVRPLDLGGIHMPENLVASCVSCNTSKGATEPAEWLAQRLTTDPTNIPSPSALEAVRLAYSGIHEDLAAQINLKKQDVALTV